MRQLLAAVAFLVLIPTQINAQAKVVLDPLFYDDFGGGDPYFTTDMDDAESVEFERANGKYRMQHKKSGYFYTHYYPVAIDQRKNYLIESEFKLLGGDDKASYGIVWGLEDLDNFYEFVINPGGKFRIKRTIRDEGMTLKSWTSSSAINEGVGGVNVLTIERKGMKTVFYINQKTVYTTLVLPLYEYEVGFILHSEVHIESDYIKVDQHRSILIAGGDDYRGKRVNLGDKINSKYDEKKGIISHDGEILLINRDDHPGNVEGPDSGDDIWMAHGGDENWGAAKNLGRPINNASHNFPVSLSADNNTLIIGNTYDEDGESEGRGYSITHRTASGWELPVTMDIEDYENIGEYAGACLAADKKHMILTLEDETSKGKNDLYMIRLRSDGSWSHPMNMGTDLNTFHHDYSPFLAADGKTLYFASKGHPGYGDADIFISRRLDNTWKKWSKPLNLGPNINSRRWEGGYAVQADGELAYFISYDNSMGEGDIFKIKLPEDAKPEAVVVLKGRVLNSKTGEPIGTELVYNDLATDENRGLARSSPSTGAYRIVLTKDHVYSFMAEKHGFASIHYNEDMTIIGEYREIEHDIYLTPLEVNQKVVMNNVFFEPNKAVLLGESDHEIDRLVKMMKKNPSMEVEIGGHTNPSKAPDSFHNKLSKERAQAVYDYLIKEGVKESHLSFKGYGKTVPLDEGRSVNEKMKNMRVEFMITRY